MGFGLGGQSVQPSASSEFYVSARGAERVAQESMQRMVPRSRPMILAVLYGLALVARAWRVAYEFEMTRQAWKGGARVPASARRVENMFAMRYLGGKDGPAMRLHDLRLGDPERIMARVLGGLRTLVDSGVVHGDLSAFNILVHEGEPWFIDFSEAVRIDRTGMSPWARLSEAEALLRRGLTSLGAYFRRYGLAADTEPLVRRALASFDRFGVLQ